MGIRDQLNRRYAASLARSKPSKEVKKSPPPVVAKPVAVVIPVPENKTLPAPAPKKVVVDGGWGARVTKPSPPATDPFDRPRQVSILSLSPNEGMVVRLDADAIRVLTVQKVQSVELRIVMRYGGLVIRRVDVAELSGIAASMAG